MSDPRTEPVPDDSVGQIRAFAKDLAYGALYGDWPPNFVVYSGYGELNTSTHEAFKAYLVKKWMSNPPNMYLLVSFGYAQVQRHDPIALPGVKYTIGSPSTSWEYVLTDKAFSLLEQPVPTSIFISYRRQESSAFALLVLARFKALGLEPFLDVNIEPGDEWHAQLEAEVNSRENFICLVGPTTLESEYVRREISWALEANTRIVPIWHNGFNDVKLVETQERYPELAPFLAKQAIKVEQENTVAYESAIIQLLNRFGVTP